MGSIYARGTTLWIGYHDETGKRICRSSGYKVGQEARAKELLDEVERISAEAKVPPVVVGPLASEAVRPSPPGPTPCLQGPTVREFGAQWIEARKDRVASVGDELGQLVNHVYPRIGHMLMRDVRSKHIRDLVLDLRASNVRRRGTGKGEGTSKIAPRTVRHIFATLHRFFKSAVIDEVIAVNPVLVEKGVLPKNVDKDPSWRATAVFDRSEVIALISDKRIPEVRRVLNALKALAAVRHGEAAGVRWSHYHPEYEPLGKLIIARSYEHDRTKSQISREVPVHAALAKVLDRWKSSGWEAAFGRAPTPADLIVPGRDGQVWDAHDADDFFKDDLIELGFRHRRGHDLRRSFITLAQVDGARRDILKVITHGPSGDDIVSLYTSFPWPTLCAEVAKLAISLPATPPNLTLVPATPDLVPATPDPTGSRDGGQSETEPVTATFTTVATVPATAIPKSPVISSRCPGMIRGPTVYETVALPLSYTGEVRAIWYPSHGNLARAQDPPSLAFA